MSLEELRKLKNALCITRDKMKYEEKMVVASISNPEHDKLMKQLKDKKHPKFVTDLINAQNKRMKTSEVNQDKLIEYCATLSGVTINKISVEGIFNNGCLYVYKTDVSIGNLEFNITYRSNKPPDGHLKTNEIVDELKITMKNSIIQKEIQEGLEYFSQNPTFISLAISFLKSFHDMKVVRKNICTKIIIEYQEYLNLAVDGSTGHVVLSCKGINHPEDHFDIFWQIKWNKTDNLSRDYFTVETHFTDAQLTNETKQIFLELCNYAVWGTLDQNKKISLLRGAVVSLIDADSRERSSSSNISSIEYSSVQIEQ